jgi:hypothetical protein
MIIRYICIFSFCFICRILGDVEDTTVENSQLLAIVIDFGIAGAKPVDDLKKALVKRGFDWSSVYAYSTVGNNIVFVARNEKVLGKKSGASELYLLLAKMDDDFGYTLKSLGLFVVKKTIPVSSEN